MITEIINNVDDTSLRKAAEIIKKGGLVAFPTETVYGLGANALIADAAKKVYEAKGRPSDNPLIIHLARAEDAEKYCHTNETFYRIAKLYMPGPITVILPKRDIIPYSVTGGLETVAVRIPSNQIAHKLIEYSECPIAAPSANLSGKPSCTSFEHVIEDMYGRIDMILNGGDCEIGLESTIITVCGNDIKILRPGKITVEMLTADGFNVTLDKAVTEKLGEGEKPLAPGMKYRHYAPRASVILLSGDDENVERYMSKYVGDDSVAFICFEEYSLIKDSSNARIIGKENDLDLQAKKIFDMLREFDTEPKIKTVYAKLPSKNGIGLAVYNRMLKAAGYQIINV